MESAVSKREQVKFNRLLWKFKIDYQPYISNSEIASSIKYSKLATNPKYRTQLLVEAINTVDSDKDPRTFEVTQELIEWEMRLGSVDELRAAEDAYAEAHKVEPEKTSRIKPTMYLAATVAVVSLGAAGYQFYPVLSGSSADNQPSLLAPTASSDPNDIETAQKVAEQEALQDAEQEATAKLREVAIAEQQAINRQLVVKAQAEQARLKEEQARLAALKQQLEDEKNRLAAEARRVELERQQLQAKRDQESDAQRAAELAAKQDAERQAQAKAAAAKKQQEERRRQQLLAEQRKKQAEAERQRKAAAAALKAKQEKEAELAKQQAEEKARQAQLAAERRAAEAQAKALQAQLAQANQYSKDLYAWEAASQIYPLVSYPQWAKQFKQQGEVTVEFTVDRQGALQEIVRVIPEDAGHLGKALTDAVREAEPYRPVPGSLSSNQLTVAVSYDFKLNQRSAKLPAKPVAPQGLTASTNSQSSAADVAWANYRLSVLKQITESIDYPFWAKRKKQTGNVKGLVVLNRDGSVSSVELLEKTRHKELNQEVLNTFNRIGSFDAFPAEVNQQQLQLEFTHVFKA